MQGIQKSYRDDTLTTQALAGVDLSVQAGEFAAIMGPSGSGKSTLLNILGCLDEADEGSYLLFGEEMQGAKEQQLGRVRNQVLAFVFQGFNLIPGKSALANVELQLKYRGIPPAQRRQMAQQALEQVGLSHRLHYRPAQLSGGQQQRVAVARALAARPRLLLADEPTGNLDSASAQEVLCAMEQLRRRGTTIVMITHDPGLAARADRVWVMGDGVLTPASN